MRSAEAVLLSGDDEVLEGMSTSAEGRREDKRRMLAAVLETLFNAANLSDGKLRAGEFSSSSCKLVWEGQYAHEVQMR